MCPLGSVDSNTKAFILEKKTIHVLKFQDLPVTSIPVLRSSLFFVKRYPFCSTEQTRAMHRKPFPETEFGL